MDFCLKVFLTIITLMQSATLISTLAVVVSYFKVVVHSVKEAIDS